jgi:hypothetical protein
MGRECLQAAPGVVPPLRWGGPGPGRERRPGHTLPMTTTDRAAELHALYLRLDELTTAEEIETYGDFLHHLGDLIADLDQEAEEA